MSEESEANARGVDFALVAYREEGVWQVQELDDDLAADLDRFAVELRRYPGDGGSLGLVSVDEDFFLLVRVLGPETRLLLSDVTAATDWPIARSVRRPPRPAAARRRRGPGARGRPRHRRRPRHGRDGHGRAARRPRPLPRRDARPTSPPSSASAGSTTSWSASAPPCEPCPRRPGSPRCGEALAEARAALATSDVPIGAVVVDADGRRGRHRAQPSRGRRRPHRARRGGRAARRPRRPRGEWRLDGCTLVVTLEPCTMCAGAVVLSRVDRLVFGAFDPKAGAVGSLWDVVRDRRLNHRPEVRQRRARRRVGRAAAGVLRRPPRRP